MQQVQVMVFYGILIAVSGVALFFKPQFAVWIGILWGVILTGYFFKWVLVLIAPLFKNDPNAGVVYGPEFTEIEPGQAKIIRRGSQVVDIRVNSLKKELASKVLIRGTSLDRLEGLHPWDIVNISEVERRYPGEQVETAPKIPDSAFLADWQRFIHEHSGLYFTGIQKWQGVHIQRLARRKRFVENGQIVFKEHEDFTDHVRIEPFIWYVEIPGVDLRGRYKATIFLALSVYSFNPYLTAWKVSNWGEILTNMVTSRVQTYCRVVDADTLIAAVAGGVEAGERAKMDYTHELAQAVLTLNCPTGIEQYGLRLVSVEVKDINLDLTEAEREDWSAVWRAQQRAEATRLLEEAEGEGKAKGLIHQIKAMKDDPEIAALLKRWESIENAGASGANLFIGEGGSDGNREQLALLQQLIQEVRKLKGEGGEK